LDLDNVDTDTRHFPTKLLFLLDGEGQERPNIYNRAITVTKWDHSPGRRTNKSESSQSILGVPNTIEREKKKQEYIAMYRT